VLAQGSVAPRVTSSEVSQSSAPPEPTLFDRGIRDQTAAQLALMKFIGAESPSADNPCNNRAEEPFMCEKQTLKSWDELKDINRPALLTLVTAEKKWVYLFIIGLGENKVRARHEGKDIDLPWSDVAEAWNGDLLYVWSRPAEFKGAIQQGDKGDLVDWVAEQFARLDKQSSPLTRQYYTDRLKTRVELFQSSNKIVPTGVFDAQTLRRLNEALGVDKTLIDLDKQSAAVKGSPAGGQ
jgi:general secretion pathway protein A